MFIICFELRAAGDSYKKGIHIDLGGYQTHLKQRFEAPSGFENQVSSFSGYARIRATLLLGKKLGWEPSVGTLIPWKSGKDGNVRKFTSHLDLTFTYPFANWLRFRLGPGVQWLLSIADGGPVELNNGTSTSTFYTPGYASHSFTLTAQSGLSFLLDSKVSLNLEIYGSGLLNRLRRNFDIAATLGWRL